MKDEKTVLTVRGDVRIYNRKLTQEDLDAIKDNPYALYKSIEQPKFWAIGGFWRRLRNRIRSIFR